MVAHNKVRRLKPRVLVVTGPDKTPVELPVDGRPALRPEDRRRRSRSSSARPRRRRLSGSTSRTSTSHDADATLRPQTRRRAPRRATREDLLQLLDRETAIARATDGRLAVLVLELRRVDRLQALLQGPGRRRPRWRSCSSALRKALRAEDRVAPRSTTSRCASCCRASRTPRQAVLAAVKVLRALDRPIAHEGGTAVLRPCVGIATVPEHGFDPAELLMAADVSRHIAATREEGYHVVQAEDTRRDRGLPRPRPRPRARDPRQRARDRTTSRRSSSPPAGPWASRRCVRWRHADGGRRARRDDRRASPSAPASSARSPSGSSTRCCARPRRWHADGHRAAPRGEPLDRARSPTAELPTVVDQAMKTWGVTPPTVTLEITESSMIADAERSVAILTRLKAVGVQLSIDDFGSGLLVARAPAALPARRAQDRPALRRADAHRHGRPAIVRSVIDLAHNFDLRAVAEGVEDAAAPARSSRASAATSPRASTSARRCAEKAFREWWAAQAKGT